MLTQCVPGFVTSYFIITDHWKSIPTISGHYGPVQDIAWEPMGGEFLLSVSSDQTTRAHAPWILDSKNIAWRELARPQIHGYDMRCICFISSILFLSGADEKVNSVAHFMFGVLRVLCWI